MESTTHTSLTVADITRLSVAPKELLIEEIFKCMAILNLVRPPDDNRTNILCFTLKKYFKMLYVSDLGNACELYAIGSYGKDAKELKASMSIQFMSGVLKLYMARFPDKWTEAKKSKYDKVIESTDEQWYNGLIHCLEGTVMPSTKLEYPNHQTSEPMIPFTWDWNAVYRHLLVINKADKGASDDMARKRNVMLWIDLTYPHTPHQRFRLGGGNIIDISDLQKSVPKQLNSK